MASVMSMSKRNADPWCSSISLGVVTALVAFVPRSFRRAAFLERRVSAARTPPWGDSGFTININEKAHWRFDFFPSTSYVLKLRLVCVLKPPFGNQWFGVRL